MFFSEWEVNESSLPTMALLCLKSGYNFALKEHNLEGGKSNIKVEEDFVLTEQLRMSLGCYWAWLAG